MSTSFFQADSALNVPMGVFLSRRKISECTASSCWNSAEGVCPTGLKYRCPLTRPLEASRPAGSDARTALATSRSAASRSAYVHTFPVRGSIGLEAL